jgi:hypothetical protein
MMPQQMPATAFPQAPPGAFPMAPPAPIVWQTPPAPRTAAPQAAMPVNAAMARDQAPRPIFRGQAPDAPTTPPAPLRLPSPEALGIVTTGPPTAPAAAATDIDWNNVRARLRQLGAIGFHLDQLDGRQWRATFLMPVSGQQARHVEASAASDAVAVLSALQQAETLAQHR